MYYVSTQGIDECAVNVHYYFISYFFSICVWVNSVDFDLRKSFEMCF